MAIFKSKQKVNAARSATSTFWILVWVSTSGDRYKRKMGALRPFFFA
jgi:hypothetical protein